MASSGYWSSLRSPQRVSLILLHGVTDFAAICKPVPGKKIHCRDVGRSENLGGGPVVMYSA